MDALFRELLLISIGKREEFSMEVSAKDLAFLYGEAKKQAMVGFLFAGIERTLIRTECDKEEKNMIFQWLASCKSVERLNLIQRERLEELTSFFAKNSVRTTLLKGQGYARFYPIPERRQCGDIDLWVDANRDNVAKLCWNKWGIDYIDCKNMVLENFPGAHVELHFIPSWFYNPFVDRKFRSWYRNFFEEQLRESLTNSIYTPTIDFDLVFCCVHIYKHIFDEGIGLRQLTDYYYILHHSSVEQRQQAYVVLRKFRMRKFVGAIMYVLKYFFEIDDSLLLCKVNEKQGVILLQDILCGGNFGHHNEKNKHGKENRIMRAIRNVRHNSEILFDYPSEVLWSPLWKIWHWCWRKKNGYL